MTRSEYIFSKQYQDNLLKLAQEGGMEARPVEHEQGFDVEYKCKECQQWELDVNGDALCMICYYMLEETL